MQFPIHVLSEYGKSLVNAIYERVPGMPKEAIAMVMLANVSASLGKNLIAIEQSKGIHHRPNEYYLITATSGAGKTTSMNVLNKPSMEAEQSHVESWRQKLPELEAQVEGLKAEILNLEGKRKKKITEGGDYTEITKAVAQLKAQCKALEGQLIEPKLSFSSITSEALGGLLARNGGYAAYFSSEAGSAIEILMGKHTSNRPDDSALLSCYSGDTIDDLRISREGKVESPMLSICWLITLDKVKELYDKGRMVEGGLLPRMLLCPVESRTTARRAGLAADPQELDGYGDYAACIGGAFRAYRLGDEVKEVKVEGAASGLLDDFKAEVNGNFENKSPVLQVFAVRWLEHTMKLAIALHVLKHGGHSHEEVLTAETVQGAIELMRFLIGRFFEFTDITVSSGMDEQAVTSLMKYCKRKAASNGTIVFKARDIKGGVSCLRNTPTQSIDELLESLASDGQLTKLPISDTQTKPHYQYPAT